MKAGILVYFLSCLFVTAARGQDYVFKVLANKGANEYKTGGAWLPLKTGTSLKKDDELKLSENAYVGLVHAKGRPLEVKTAGVHTIAVLASQITESSSVLAKYTDFILSTNSAEQKKNRLSATGAVHRAVEESALRLTLPPNQYAGIFNDRAVVLWDGSRVKGPYVVRFRNMFDDVLLEKETTETRIEVDLGEQQLSQENALFIEVSAKDNPNIVSERHLIKKLAPAQQQQVAEELKSMGDAVEGEHALAHYILAGFYEENGLLIDAISTYEKLLTLEPDVPTYRESYQDFLVRNNLQ